MPGLHQFGNFVQSVELPNWKPGTIQFHHLFLSLSQSRRHQENKSWPTALALPAVNPAFMVVTGKSASDLSVGSVDAGQRAETMNFSRPIKFETLGVAARQRE